MAQELMPLEQVGAKRTGVHTGGIKQKYVLNDHGRQMLVNTYDGTSECITLLAQRIGVPRWTVKRWASDLGLARQKEPFWTEQDEEYLKKNLHRSSLGDIAKHLHRTKVAVRLKAKRLGVNKTAQEGYTMRGLCMALGCNHHKVKQWIDCGWLKGRRRKTERVDGQGGDVWLFVDRNIREFVIAHPNEIDQRRIDWLWMVDLLAGGDYHGIGVLSKVD